MTCSLRNSWISGVAKVADGDNGFTIECLCADDEDDLPGEVHPSKCNNPCEARKGGPSYACGGDGFASVYALPKPDNVPELQEVIPGTKHQSILLGCFLLETNKGSKGAKLTEVKTLINMTNEVRIDMYEYYVHTCQQSALFRLRVIQKSSSIERRCSYTTMCFLHEEL